MSETSEASRDLESRALSVAGRSGISRESETTRDLESKLSRSRGVCRIPAAKQVRPRGTSRASSLGRGAFAPPAAYKKVHLQIDLQWTSLYATAWSHFHGENGI